MCIWVRLDYDIQPTQQKFDVIWCFQECWFVLANVSNLEVSVHNQWKNSIAKNQQQRKSKLTLLQARRKSEKCRRFVSRSRILRSHCIAPLVYSCESPICKQTFIKFRYSRRLTDTSETVQGKYIDLYPSLDRLLMRWVGNVLTCILQINEDMAFCSLLRFFSVRTWFSCIWFNSRRKSSRTCLWILSNVSFNSVWEARVDASRSPCTRQHKQQNAHDLVP